MQIFEYYFNPKNEEGKSFKSFVYEPKSSLEKKLGNLYIVGEIKTDNSNLLERLAKYIKERFYRSGFNTLEKSLPETLKKTNEFLAEEVKKENVSWLGNLGCGIFSINNSNLNFTKTGDFKILLLRSQKITNIGQNLEKEDIDPYPLKVFFNIVSGKLAPSDLLIVVSNNVYFFLKEKGVLDKIANSQEYNEKNIKEAFPSKLFTEEEGSKISGLCVLFLINDIASSSKEYSFQEKIKKTINPEKITKKRNSLIIIFFIIVLFIGFIIFSMGDKSKKEDNNTIKNTLIEEEKEKIYNDEKIEIKENIIPFFTFAKEKDQILYFKKELFSFESPDNFYKFNSENKEKINLPENFDYLTSNQDNIFFISKEGKLFSLKENILSEIEKGFDLIEPYGSNLYFINTDKCNISRYSLNNKKTENWFKEKKENQTCKSVAIDSSLWLLSKENSLDIYYQGVYQKSIQIPKGITNIKTSFDDPSIYLIHPSSKRIIIIDKEGNLIKQIYSEKFEKIKDIYVLREEKIIFVLSGNNIYKIDY